MVNLFDLDPQGLTDFFVSLGEKPFRATQVLKWVYQQNNLDFDTMTNLSKVLRHQLKETVTLSLPQIVTTQASQDGTYKWLLQLADGQHIETVFIPEEGRSTLCVSAQVGCVLTCNFCATARHGFKRNLHTREMIAQLWLAEQELAARLALTAPPPEDATTADRKNLPKRVISNVVFMGMGEPLANFANVVKAIQLMRDDCSYGLSWRRITVSTAGIVPAILRLKEQCPVSLAISLHAPTDALRNELVPINKKYPLKELLAACRNYLHGEENRRQITFEYIMLENINDSPAHAHALAKLLRGLQAKVNLIPCNPFPGNPYRRSPPEVIDRFRDILLEASYITVTRKTRGDDIAAACGQLAGKMQSPDRHDLEVHAV